MKLLFPVILLLSGWVSGQGTVPSDFKRIPEILDNTELLYPFIIPDKKYGYWSVFRNNLDPHEAVIYESQMPPYLTINDPAPERGFFQKCLGENCFSYIIACENDRSKYFTDEQQLRSFIGFVDNLPEAILVAATYGFQVDTGNALGSSYKIDDQYILIYVSKPRNDARKESFFVKINRKSDKLEAKSNGNY